MESQELLRFLNDPANWYLSQDKQLRPLGTTAVSIDECIIYQVEKIEEGTKVTFEGMRNILDAMCLPGIIFFYLVKGEEESLAYYYGVSVDATYYCREYTGNKILRKAAEVFEAVFAANYPLNTLVRLQKEEREELRDQIIEYESFAIIEGVPGEFNDNTTFLGADKVKQAMQSDDFIALELLKPLSLKENAIFTNSILNVYTALEELANITVNCAVTGSKTCNFNVAASQLYSNSRIRTSNETRKEFRIQDDDELTTVPNEPEVSAGTGGGIVPEQNTPIQSPTSTRVAQVLNGVLNKGILGEDARASAPPQPLQITAQATQPAAVIPTRRGRQRRGRRLSAQNINQSAALANVFSAPTIPVGTALASQFAGSSLPLVDGDFLISDLERQVGKGTNNTRLFTSSDNISNSRSNTNSSSRSQVKKIGDRNAVNWMSYIEGLLYPRLDYGRTAGLYMLSTGIFAKRSPTLIKLSSVLKYTYNSKGYNNIPMVMTELMEGDIRRQSFAEFQLPMYECGNASRCICEPEIIARATFSQMVTPGYACGGNYLSSRELSSIIALPL